MNLHKLIVKLIYLLAFNLMFFQSSYGQVNTNAKWIPSYYTTYGKFVKGHYRTTQNNTINDNYSTSPNVNPYTGKKGYIKPNKNYKSRVVYPAYKARGLDKLVKKETFVYVPPSDQENEFYLHTGLYPRYLIKTNANLRTDGNKNSNVILEMKKNQFVYVIPFNPSNLDQSLFSNNWSYVYYAGGRVKGYVHNSLIVSYPKK